MKIEFKKGLNKKDSTLLIPVFSDKEIGGFFPELRGMKRSGIFLGEAEEIFPDFEHSPAKSELKIYFGLGKYSELSGKTVREAFAVFVKNLRKFKKNNFTILCLDELIPFGQELGEALILGDYELGMFQTGENQKKREEKFIGKVSYLAKSRSKEFEAAFEKGFKLGEAVNFVRDLVNSPANIADEKYFVAKSKEAAKKSKAKITVLENAALKKLKMGALLGVNQGSAEGARLITIEYKPWKAKNDPIILVGKGVLFDTGGYNLKLTNNIETMHMDMAGAALVLGVMQLLREFGINKHIIGVMPITQNMVDANSQRPNDIITSFSGKTIQILNTDAEGRLILADAISYAQWKYPKAKTIIDFATLTGACMVALGDRYAGLFGNDETLMKSLQKSGQKADELLWPLPIHQDYFESMRDDMADLRNMDIKAPSLAGASKAAAFIQHFIEKDKSWAHLDIAGTAFVNNPKKYDCKYGTGFGVRMMIDFLENL